MRDAEVLWRRREWQQSRPAVASSIGYVNRMYRLAAPPLGVSADRVDELWDHFEKPLPAAIRARQHARMMELTGARSSSMWLPPECGTLTSLMPSTGGEPSWACP